MFRMLKLWFLFIHQYLNHSSLNIDATFSTSGSYLNAFKWMFQWKKGIKYGSRPLWSSNNISTGSKRDSDTQHIAQDSSSSEPNLNGYVAGHAICAADRLSAWEFFDIKLLRKGTHLKDEIRFHIFLFDYLKVQFTSISDFAIQECKKVHFINDEIKSVRFYIESSHLSSVAVNIFFKCHLLFSRIVSWNSQVESIK